MNEIPDEHQIFEASLRELSPHCELSTDQLIYQAGYAAATADGRQRHELPFVWTKILSSAAAGAVAASCLFLTFWPDAPQRPASSEEFKLAAVQPRPGTVVETIVIRSTKGRPEIDAGAEMDAEPWSGRNTLPTDVLTRDVSLRGKSRRTPTMATGFEELTPAFLDFSVPDSGSFHVFPPRSVLRVGDSVSGANS